MHISAVERTGLSGLNEGQKVKSDVQVDRGKAAGPRVLTLETSIPKAQYFGRI